MLATAFAGCCCTQFSGTRTGDALGDAGGGDAGGGDVIGEADATSGNPSTEVKRYQLSDLKVGLGDYLPPLDEGRVEIARPAEWKVGSRQQGYVVWFHRFRDVQLLPQIRVTAEPAPEAAPDAMVDSVEQLTQRQTSIKITDFEFQHSTNDCENVANKLYPEINKATQWLKQHASA